LGLAALKKKKKKKKRAINRRGDGVVLPGGYSIECKREEQNKGENIERAKRRGKGGRKGKCSAKRGRAGGADR